MIETEKEAAPLPVRSNDGLGIEHAATTDCWCEPEKIYVDPETGDTVYLHREIH